MVNFEQSKLRWLTRSLDMSMMETPAIPAILSAAFRAYADDSSGSADTDGLRIESAIGECVRCLRDAFYAPRSAAKAASSSPSSKFLELEKALMTVFDELSDTHSELLWVFVVRFILTLSAEPSVQASEREHPECEQQNPPDADASASRKRKAKVTRTRMQPNAPLAYVVVSALRKLFSTPGNEQKLSKCLHETHKSSTLRAFCRKELTQETRDVDAKLLVEMLELFRVDFVARAEIEALASQLLRTKTHSSVIRLCVAYETLSRWDFPLMMRTMIKAKDWGSAELLAKTFERPGATEKVLAKVLVDEAIGLQEFKRAHRLVHNFGLQHEFPDIEQLYSRDALLKLVEKQRWALALSFVGSDAALQRVLLTHLVAARQWHHATLLAREKMGLSDFDPEKQALELEELVGPASSLSTLPVNGYLELQLPDESVVFCDSEEKVQAAMQFVMGLKTEDDGRVLVGLDVEWRPTSTKIASHTGATTTTAVASILQIATASRVFLIDLLTLHESSLLFAFLHALFSSNEFLKLGFGFDSDLKVLHQTFPERAALRSVLPFLELSAVVQKTLGASVGNSLSNATARILGKPLDKRMQLSNWDERPLTHSQVVYAALDAFCLLQIVEHIRRYGLVDDKGVATSWIQVCSEMEGAVGLSAPMNDPDAIAIAAESRREYQRDWQAKLHHHGVVESKDLLTTAQVEAVWHQLVSSEDAQTRLNSFQVVPVDQLQPLLAIAEQEPTAYVAVNSICFFADERPCVACIDAGSKLDTSRLAGLCGLSRRKIKLATAAECETLWGFSPGTVPPFGHRPAPAASGPIPIFVDVTLKEYDNWVTGSGSHDQLLVLDATTFFRVVPVRATADIGLHRNGRTPHKQEESRTEAAGVAEPDEYKFLADTMVGRVGRWLRTIGIDVVLWDAVPSAGFQSSVDRKSALLGLAAREQRIVLTRDKKLADRRDAGACFVVSSDDPHQQFQEIKAHFALELKKEAMMTRCAKCNTKGFEIVDREYVRTQTADVVHENVLQVVTDFWRCVGCHKIYWEGPKYSSAYENMVKKFQDGTI